MTAQLIDDAMRATEILIAKDGATATLALAGPPENFPAIPAEFLGADRLLSRNKINAAIAAAGGAAESLREARDRLRRALAGWPLAIGAGNSFFGATRLAGAALEAEVSLEVEALLAEGEAGLTGGLAIRLEASARAQLELGDGGATWAMTFTASAVSGTDLTFALLPHVAIGRLPGLPPLDLRFPRWPLTGPALEWPALEGLDRLLDLMLPAGVGAVEVAWTTRPVFALTLAGGDLTLATTTAGVGQVRLQPGDVPVVDITDFRVAAVGGRLALHGQLTAAARVSIDLPDLAGPAELPVRVTASGITLKVAANGAYALGAGTRDLTLAADLTVGRLEIASRRDPSLNLVLSLAYRMTAGPADVASGLTALEIKSPDPLDLVCKAVGAVEGMVRLAALLPDAPAATAALARLGRIVEDAIAWMGGRTGGAAALLPGVADSAARAIGRLAETFRTVGRNVAIEIRLDAATGALRQVIVSPASSGEARKLELAGFWLDLPGAMQPALVLDLTGPPLVALAILPGAGAPAVLSTDLWLGTGSELEAAQDMNDAGQRPDRPLLRIDVTPNQEIALVAFEGGRVRFLQRLDGLDAPVEGAAHPGGVVLRNAGARLRLVEPAWAADLIVTVEAETNRLLSFLALPKGAGDGFGQSVKVTGIGEQSVAAGVAEVDVAVEIQLAGMTSAIETTLKLSLDLQRLKASIAGNKRIAISGSEERRFDLLGLSARLKKKGPPAPEDEKFEQFVLDFSAGEPRLVLSPEAELELTYGRIAEQGQGVRFRVESFAVAKGVFDLDARVDPDTPVTLAGLGTSFRFSDSGLSIRGGKIQAFTLNGSGPLPPALVGEATATIRIAFGPGLDGRVTVLSAGAELDKSDEPFVCSGTRFTFAISRIGLDFRDFGKDGGFQFFFLLTGWAAFRPPAGETVGGLLKHLSSLRIILDKAPLAGDARLLMRAIEFQVAVEPKQSVTLFDLFRFELRGFGLHPASPLFDGKPAMSLSGQISFLASGDSVSASFDFHKLWIAPPAKGQSLPQIRCDGLGVGLNLGVASVEGTAIAVDGQLPTLYAPEVLPANITANGFLASGRLSIQGWASMAAAMGFLELRDKDSGALRHAFFFYGEMGQLGVVIPTPLGNLYLREFGFGLGHRFTIAGLAAADQVTDPKKLVSVLDTVSKFQGDLADFRSWRPEPQGDRITLALRAMISVACASPGKIGLVKAEEGIDNFLLFDVVAALRSDLTFLMNVRAWLSVNYWTWTKERAAIAERPTLRGYLYISVPRQEFLARMISDGPRHVGKTPELPETVVGALQSLTWSSTLYIRPGLFHAEYGWPLELKYEWPGPGASQADRDRLHLVCSGGMITRIEDSAVLYGLAFRAVGSAQFGGSFGGGSLGASVSARADFRISAKLIAYLSLRSAGETLFYGSLDFAVTIAFQVRVWLDFKIWKAHIHLEVSFTARLTVTVALEMAAGASKIAGRGRATIAVSAFGRTIGLGVGFGFNESYLGDARRRVERFLSLGLAAQIPKPEAGLQPAPPPAKAGEKAAEVLDRQAKKVEGTLDEKPAEEGEAVVIAGDEIGQSRFWAFLFPLPRPGDHVLQLVPRDWTTLGAEEEEGEEGDGFTLQKGNGTFFAPPILGDGGHDYDISLAPDPLPGVSLRRFDPANQTELLPVELGGSTAIRANHEGVVATDVADPNQKVSFAELCHDFFVWNRVGEAVKLKQPGQITINGKRTPLPEDPDARAQVLREAAADHALLSRSRQAWRDIEQRRSAAIGAVAEGASELARRAVFADGAWIWPARVADALDVRDFGLTFVLSGERAVEALFGTVAATTPTPPKSRFLIRSRTDGKGPAGEPRDVRLFNYPSRFFENANPRLAGQSWRIGEGRIHLDWDLEPAWNASPSIWSDPEQHARHYRIERIVLLDGQVDARFTRPGAAPMTSKAAAPLSFDGERWQALRPAAQFVDDFADLPEDFRSAALGLGETPWQDWQEVIGAAELRILYVVTPIDAAGTAGFASTIVVAVEAPQRPVPAILRAEAQIRYGAISKVGDQPVEPELSLAVFEQRSAGGGGRYEIKVRAERGYPAGVYGADALTDARRRPGPDDFARDEVGDRLFELTFIRPDGAPPSGSPAATDQEKPVEFTGPIVLGGTIAPFFRVALPLGTGSALAALLDALGVRPGSGVQPVRLALRRMTMDGAPPSPWLPVETTLAIRADTAPEKPWAIDTAVFEHPRAVAFEPLAFGDLAGEAGRLLVTIPKPEATVASLFGAGGDAVRLVRDPARRIGTRLRWNGRPCAARDGAVPAGDPRAHADLIGGVDVFEIDMAAVTGDDLQRFARRVARVQALPPALRSSCFAQIEDFAGIEAHYPSEAARIYGAETRQAGISPARRGRRGAWFSLAESLPRLPAWPLRRSLAIDHDLGALTALLERGRPRKLKIDLLHWPVGADEKTPKVKRPSDDEPPESFDAENGWGITSISELLRELVWHREEKGDTKEKNDTKEKDDPDARYAAAPQDFAGVVLKITGTRTIPDGAEIETGAVELPLDLDPPLHPLLADVLDEIRWSEDGSYRRYVVLPDGAPETQAKSIGAFMDERPPERDPYGWAVLRTFGLATGLRLHDAEALDFLGAKETAEQLDAALQRLRPRYEGKDIGAPMIEILTRPTGLFKVASFDEADPGARRGAGAELVRDHGEPLVQVSLRPRPDSIADPAERAVRYFTVTAAAGAEFDPAQLPAEMLVELIDLSGGLAGGRAEFFAQAPSDQLGAWTDGAAGRIRTEKRELTGTGDAPTAILRVTAHTAFGPEHLAAAFPKARLRPVDTPPAFADREVATDPFERFDPLPARRLGALALDEGKNATRISVERFRAIAARRFAEGWPSGAEGSAEAQGAWTEFLARLAPWLARFLVHGPGQPEGDGAPSTPVALATVTKAEPWRVPAAPDGTLEIVLVHKTRFALRRRYVVLPFGRYDSFARALAGGSLPDPKLPRLAKDPAYASVGLDITAPRTEPLAAPVFVSARRLNRALEFVLSRHEEEMQSEANSALADALQFEHVAIGFWREFASAAWARSMWERLGLGGEGPDLLPPVARHFDVPPPELSFGRSDSFSTDVEARQPPEGAPPEGETPAPAAAPMGGTLPADAEPLKGEILPPLADPLPLRIPGGWRGVTALRVRGAPHFYRLHAAAFAAAGVIVSEPSAAAIHEGFYRNGAPWDDEGGLRPTWSMSRFGPDGRGREGPVFRIPLASYRDGIPPEDRARWHADEAPAFRLPDPAVGYVIELVAGVAEGEAIPGGGTVAAEIEFMPRPSEEDPGAAKTVADHYLAAVVGTRLGEVVHGLEHVPAAARNATLVAETSVRSEGPAPQLDTSLGDLEPHFLRFEAPSGQWPNWGPVAPVGVAVMTITRPEGAFGQKKDWGGYQADVEVWRKAFADFAALTLDVDAGKIAAELGQWATVATDGGWFGKTNPTFPPTVQIPVPVWRAGWPVLSVWTLPGPGQRNRRVAFAVKDWRIPEGAFAFAARDELRRPGAFRTSEFYFPTTVADPYLALLRSRDRAFRLQRDVAPFKGAIPASTRGLPPALIATAAAVAPPAPIEIVRPVEIRAVLPPEVATAPLLDGERHRLAALFAALEDFKVRIDGVWQPLGADEALVALAPLEETGLGQVILPLSHHALQWAQPALDDLKNVAGVTVTIPDPDRATLRRPPLAGELHGDLIGADLARFLRRLAEDSCFGENRRPRLRMRRGLAAVQHRHFDWEA